MPQYWEQSSGAKTQLQVNTPWPDSGGPAYAGNLNSLESWTNSPYVSHQWYTADFAVNGGLYTSALNSCSALVYLFGPSGGDITHGALWHVNCSVYSNDHTPAKALEAIGVGDLKLRFVVIGFNSVTNRVSMVEATRGTVSDFSRFIKQHAPELEPWIYVGRSDMFGVSKEGHVGLPWRMATDNVSPRRSSVSGMEAGSGTDAKTGCCSCCYITTAVCHSLGRGDDCSELRTLRRFRDEILAPTPVGRAEIAEYYATAPRIVAAIDAGVAAGAVYRCLYERDLRPALAAIGRGEFTLAHSLYRDMCRRLQAQYL